MNNISNVISIEDLNKLIGENADILFKENPAKISEINESSTGYIFTTDKGDKFSALAFEKGTVKATNEKLQEIGIALSKEKAERENKLQEERNKRNFGAKVYKVTPESVAREKERRRNVIDLVARNEARAGRKRIYALAQEIIQKDFITSTRTPDQEIVNEYFRWSTNKELEKLYVQTYDAEKKLMKLEKLKDSAKKLDLQRIERSKIYDSEINDSLAKYINDNVVSITVKLGENGTYAERMRINLEEHFPELDVDSIATYDNLTGKDAKAVMMKLHFKKSSLDSLPDVLKPYVKETGDMANVDFIWKLLERYGYSETYPNLYFGYKRVKQN